MKFSVSAQRRTPIDLEAIRDTLAYIESDLANQPAFASLAAHIRSALSDIDNRGAIAGVSPAGHAETAAVFVPAFR